jgi:hypothetical protein
MPGPPAAATAGGLPVGDEHVGVLRIRRQPLQCQVGGIHFVNDCESSQQAPAGVTQVAADARFIEGAVYRVSRGLAPHLTKPMTKHDLPELKLPALAHLANIVAVGEDQEHRGQHGKSQLRR